MRARSGLGPLPTFAPAASRPAGVADDAVLPRDPAPSYRQLARTHGSLLVLLAIVVLARHLWIADLAAFLLLLTLPGQLLLRALAVPGEAIASFPVYLPAASLAVLMASGLAVDVTGLTFGFSHPLSTIPLLAGLEVTCLVLIVAGRNAPAGTAIAWRQLAPRAPDAWPLVIPLVAAAGALRLNNGHGGLLALLALCGCAAILTGAIAKAPVMSRTQLSMVLYAVSLAVTWGYSLRGDIVYGFDISTEYNALHQAVTSGEWHFAHPGDAFGAELAVTILPAQLHFLTGASDLMVLKLFYPAIIALFPVGVFALARRIIQRRWAFVAAAFIVVQSTFAQQLPALARQEIATVFYIEMIGAMFDDRLSKRQRWRLTAVFGVAMAVSHYSTTYFAIEMLILLLLCQWGVSWFRAIPKVTSAAVVALCVTAVAAVAWYGPLTRSGSNVEQVAGALASRGPDILPNQGQDVISSYLDGTAQTPISPAQYQALVARYYATRVKYVVPLADAASPRYALRQSAVPSPPVRAQPARSLLSLLELVAEQLGEILAVAGAAFMALRRSTPVPARQAALLSLGALLALSLLKFSGTAAQAYNPERAFVQAYGVLGIAMAWSLQYASSRLQRWARLVTGAAAVALLILFVQMSGVADGILGGSVGTNLSSGGEDAERFDTSAAEVAAAQWLGHQVRPGQLVYADRYAELRLSAETSIRNGVLNDVTPQTIDASAWVYASTANVVDGRARVIFDNHTVTYAFPAGFLNSNFSVVYTDGSAEVYHR